MVVGRGEGEERGCSGEGVEGRGDEEIKCHGKDAMALVLWSVLQPVPNSGHDTAERPVAPFTSACCLCHTESRDAFSAQRSGENEVGCIRGERVCIRGKRNGFVLILYPWGTDFCWYCVQWFVVSLCRVFLSYCTWQGQSIYNRCDHNTADNYVKI